MSELQDLIFTEKYRPKDFDSLVFSSKQKLLKYLNSPQSLPSFLFYGGAGTGKTSTAKLIQKFLKCDCLRLNASSERGIDVVRQKITIFARSLSSNPNIKRMVLCARKGSFYFLL